MLIFFIFF